MRAPETPESPASAHAARLLRDVGVASPLAELRVPSFEPAVDWARSGAMGLTGEADRAPRLAPGGVTAALRGAVAALAALAPPGSGIESIDGPALLGERAAHFGGRRGGRISVGGSCRLLAARDGWIAVNLARSDDWGLLPAWLEDSRGTPGETPWPYAEARVARRPTARLLERARLIGLAVAPAGRSPVLAEWCRASASAAPAGPRSAAARPRVVDLSSLWAGPLCAQLLVQCGADAVKVESLRRPDPVREAAPALFDLLHARKRSVVLDFEASQGRRELARLLEWADVVVESARPRALAQLGFDARVWVDARPGRVWLSITGYGRDEPRGHWVAFGDDAAAAAGLAAAVGDEVGPIFCGDAIADPLTGAHAAVAALGAFRTGRGALLDVSLCGVAGAALALDPSIPAAVVRCTDPDTDAWEVSGAGGRAAVEPPRARPAAGPARPPGSDTAAVLQEIASAC